MQILGLLAPEFDGVQIYDNYDIMIMEERDSHVLDPMSGIGPCICLRLKCDLEDQEEWITTSHSCVTYRDILKIEKSSSIWRQV